MNTIDLHMHSRHSNDGEFSTQALLDMAGDKHIQTIAIADHNVVGAYFEEFDAKGVTIVPAIELDCTFKGKEFHLLGYGINVYDPVFKNIKQDLHEQEKAMTSFYLAYVQNEMGLILDEDILEKRSSDGIYVAETICEAAMALEVNRDNTYLKEYYPGGSRCDNPQVNFYWDYFSQSKKGHYPISFITLEEAIAIYRQQGAMVVLAHPGNNVKEDDTLLTEILTLGIDGLEVYSSYHNEKQIEYYREKAQLNHLMMTCGSDFHGRTKPSVFMGECNMPMNEEKILIEKIKYDR